MRWKFWQRRTKELKQLPRVFEETQAIIKEIKEGLDGDFIAYWIAEDRILYHDDAVILGEILKAQTKSRRLYFFVKTSGGVGQASLRIVHLLRQKYDYITALVPLECASAGTMLVLGADKIQMGSMGYLSAIDSSLSHALSPINPYGRLVSVSQNELDRVISLWQKRSINSDKNPYESLYEHIHPLVFGAVDRMSSLSTQLTQEILSYHMKDEAKAFVISDHLNSGYPSHGYPITYKEARRIGLQVEMLPPDLDGKLLKLNSLYSKFTFPRDTFHHSLSHHDRRSDRVIEVEQEQYYYLTDVDWNFNTYNQRWRYYNDESGWRKVNRNEEGEVRENRFYIN